MLEADYWGVQQVLGERLRGHFLNHQIPAIVKNTEEWNKKENS